MSQEKFWEHMGVNYYRDVMNNMGGPRGTESVQFGMGGTGQVPNYQVVQESGELATFRGSSHKPDAGLALAFKERKVSEPYNFVEVQGLLAGAIQRSKK